jgi:hypothetical protein
MIDDRARCVEESIFSFSFMSTPTNPFDLLTTTCSMRDKKPLNQIWGELTSFGENLQKIYELRDQELINEYIFNETYAGIEAKIQICSVTLKNPTISYVLIYCVYTAHYSYNKDTGLYDNEVQGSYGIALLPSNYSVNDYGIYTCYKQAKMFICKPFFYNSMCHPKETEQKSLLCQKLYLYAGFIFDCWPYNALCTFSYKGPVLPQAIEALRKQIPELSKASLNMLYSASLPGSSVSTQIQGLARSLTTIIRPLIGGKNTKSHKHKKSHKKRKSQKKRKTTYSIFRSNK